MMNTPGNANQGHRGTGVLKILVFALVLLLFNLVPFFVAGRWDWWGAWANAMLAFLAMFIGRLIVNSRNPALLAERLHSLKADDIKAWDKKIVPLIGIVGPLFTLVIAGLNFRFNWQPPVSLAWQICGLLVMILGCALSTWALAENRFFSGMVRIQIERDHAAVETGPYRYIRHPGYAGDILYNLATPLLLGSLWALIPATLTAILFGFRTALEDRTLQEELTGYEEYTRTTRYRLLPGIW
jgi:protein-S-isoprenylcysteine O-methyltransferase Ste14